ncbi:hypothetical protein CC78DRAFT_563924 [Lojkania enalia]|uniref:SPT2 chromatin protein n=1 Tax=Lojkania enalia TaxID=147567 RepID=A0A9P4NC88_9PLEO|nr:hypothetical protein CC78DRAFT_563924 [Didymosphaeria enalia]
MSLLNNLLSSIDPSAAGQSQPAHARPTQPTSASKPPIQPTAAINGGSPAQPHKRKAEGQPGMSQVKLQRRDGPPQFTGNNGIIRPTPAPDVTKPKTPTQVPSVQYRGTAATSSQVAAKPPVSTTAKPTSSANSQNALNKTAALAPKPTLGSNTTPLAGPMSAKKGSYAAMLARAKEVQQSKPPTPPVKHEPTRILTKKERTALHAEAKAGTKGKKSGLIGPQARPTDIKAEGGTEKRKPVEMGYQGTARPAKKPVDLGYKGTARPATTTAGSNGKTVGSSAAKAKPKPNTGRYGGYARWSEDELEDEEEEEDYESDASSDMEGGFWGVEEEEELALKSAKKEDAEALREEMELKRQKEERKRKLMAMNKAAAAKRKY